MRLFMDELKILLDELVEDTFVSAILSNPTDKEYGSKLDSLLEDLGAF